MKQIPIDDLAAVCGGEGEPPSDLQCKQLLESAAGQLNNAAGRLDRRPNAADYKDANQFVKNGIPDLNRYIKECAKKANG